MPAKKWIATQGRYKFPSILPKNINKREVSSIIYVALNTLLFLLFNGLMGYGKVLKIKYFCFALKNIHIFFPDLYMFLKGLISY